MFNYRKKITNYFYLFLIVHLLIWTLIPSVTNENLPLDTIEALAWGSNLDWGFSKHPPASAFFVELFYFIFSNQDWAFYLLSQIFVIFSFFIVFKVSDKILDNKIYSFLSVILLEGIYFYNFTTPEFNVNVCQLPFWSLTVFYTWKIFEGNKINLFDIFCLAIFAAIGFLTKYLFIYLLISILILFFYQIKILKDKKFDFKYLICIEIFFVLLVPHLIWLFNNDFITIKYAFSRAGLGEVNYINHLKFPFIFLIKQILIIVPALILFYFAIKKPKLNLNFKDKKFIFLLIINLLPIFLMLLTSIITGSKIRTMWMTPFYLFFGTLLVYIFQRYIDFNNIKKFTKCFIFLFLISPISYASVSIIKEDKRTDYPGKTIADKVQKKWDTEFNDTINVILGDEWVAGNLSYHLKSRPAWEGKVDKAKLDSYSKYICLDEICIGVK